MKWHPRTLSLSCPITQSGLKEEDVLVEVSTCELQVHVQGKKLADMSGMLCGSIRQNLSWWRLRREVARRMNCGVDEAHERLTLEVELAKTTHKSWPDVWHKKEMKHPDARSGYPWTPAMEAAQDTKRAARVPLAQGPLQRSRATEEGAMPGFLFAPDDLCIGIDTLQDSKTITVRIHFETEALHVVQKIMPLEELFAADILDDRINIFLQGDEQNPILWAGLSGRCIPKSTTWALTTCDSFRNRQRNPSAPGHALAIVLKKHKDYYGSWPQLFSTCVQHPLMLKNYDELEDLLEALRGDEEDRRRLTAEQRRSCERQLSEWKEERFEGLPGAALLPRQREEAFDTLQFELSAQGSKCDSRDNGKMKSTFGMKGRCQDQNELEYVNPAGAADVLYIYPKEDHNSAFSLCSSGTIDPSVCYRLVHMAHHYSVHFVRVASVQEAIAFVKGMPSNVRLKHVVLGGHGDPRTLAWGSEDTESDTVMPELRVDEPATRELLDALYPHLTVDGTERTRSTVFLDACLNGRPVADKNMLQFVAHRLAGAEVFASKISFDNSQFVLDNYLHFNAQIIDGKQDKMVSAIFHPGLRALHFHPNRVCKKKELVMAQTMELCAELCQKAGDDCAAFIYYPNGNQRVTQVCFHSKRCDSMKRSKKGAMVFTKETEQEDDSDDSDEED
ncbi:unnamed protein product [Symbiodinium sp. CCMP2456]|nr:unnamed protein product [Symbiodinium sp. CCMP2456]